MPPNKGYSLSRAALVQATEFALLDVGIATGGTNTTLQDTHKDWPTNKFAGAMIKIIKANGEEYIRDITSNTADILTIAALPAGVTIDAGDLYAIRATMDSAGARLIRWGRDVSPAWVHAAEVVAPLIGAVLVTLAVGAGVSGYIYGFFIAAQEANDFLVNWTSATVAYSKRLVFVAAGSMEVIDQVAFNEGLPADPGTNITITNVTAGGVGMVYQAGLLYAEV